jgi:glycosyltransferase involved in cell wall biosynthesis
MTRLKRIGIDCRLAGIQHAGIGRYIENIVQRCTTDTRFEWVLFFQNARQAHAVLPGKIPQVKRVYVPVPHYSLLEQFVLPVLFWRHKLDVLHIPHFNIPLLYPGKMVVTIHDLLWHEHRGTAVTTLPAWQYWLKYAAYRVVTSAAARRAQTLFVPSHTVEKILTHYYPHSHSKIVVTPEGVGSEYLRAGKETLKKQPAEKVLVYTGSLYPHKNVRLIVQALAFLPEFTLKIVGSRTVFQEKLRRFVEQQGVQKRVEFLGHLSDKELLKLYRRSYALVFPSLSEGFGLPGLEAMAAGLPVIASDIPVFHEIYGKAAAFFNPRSVGELVETVRTLEPSRSILQNSGKKRIKKFNWNTTAQLTLAEYERS